MLAFFDNFIWCHYSEIVIAENKCFRSKGLNLMCFLVYLELVVSSMRRWESSSLMPSKEVNLILSILICNDSLKFLVACYIASCWWTVWYMVCLFLIWCLAVYLKIHGWDDFYEYLVEKNNKYIYEFVIYVSLLQTLAQWFRDEQFLFSYVRF